MCSLEKPGKMLFIFEAYVKPLTQELSLFVLAAYGVEDDSKDVLIK